MYFDNKHMVAKLIKTRRQQLGFTQQELSDKTNISLRSVQRIENGEVMPRPHTIRTLAEELDIVLPGEQLPDKTCAKKEHTSNSRHLGKQIIFTAAFNVLTLLLALAYVAQSASFPETTFEALLYAAGVLIIMTGGSLIILRTKK